MIELRWIERQVPFAYFADPVSVAATKAEKVLQYRTLVLDYEDRHLRAAKNPKDRFGPPLWTDWIDVPTASGEPGE
mgnify:FL=1